MAPPFDPLEIISHLTKTYSLLIKMRYRPATALHFPPHSPPIDTSLALSLNYSPLVISIMDQLPYFDTKQNHNANSFRDGGLVDYRDPRELERRRTRCI